MWTHAKNMTQAVSSSQYIWTDVLKESKMTGSPSATRLFEKMFYSNINQWTIFLPFFHEIWHLPLSASKNDTYPSYII